ncbi:hypothetical protein B0T24DRAFT_677328 [Lasiosphaeria ovina]|uniref:Uncharacterized protein n=1 Tax=Lasiosphaeria ovina TaxID=92902 RepID=A0AAE0NA53_9PEZI|nr:hypothetical protein B0T24DRAFT_677328 [Lasiosphaeria ovina]
MSEREQLNPEELAQCDVQTRNLAIRRRARFCERDSLQEPPHVEVARTLWKNNNRHGGNDYRIPPDPNRDTQLVWEQGCREFTALMGRATQDEMAWFHRTTTASGTGSGTGTGTGTDEERQAQVAGELVAAMPATSWDFHVYRIVYFAGKLARFYQSEWEVVDAGSRAVATALEAERVSLAFWLAVLLDRRQPHWPRVRIVAQRLLGELGDFGGKLEAVKNRFDGLVEVDDHSLVIDATANDSYLGVVRETGCRPAAILRVMMAWDDGFEQVPPAGPADFHLPLLQADTNTKNWAVSKKHIDRTVPDWLNANYTIAYRAQPRGFMSLVNPTLYIRK